MFFTDRSHKGTLCETNIDQDDYIIVSKNRLLLLLTNCSDCGQLAEVEEISCKTSFECGTLYVAKIVSIENKIITIYSGY